MSSSSGKNALVNAMSPVFRGRRNLGEGSATGVRAAALLILWSIASVSLGANWFFQPAGSVGAGYEGNADLTAEDPINTTRYDIEASARGGHRTERSQIVGAVRAALRRYPGNESLDSDLLSATLNSAFLATELDRFILDLRYDRGTSRLSEITTTGNIIENVPRNAITIGPSWQRRLTDETTVGLGYLHNRVRFGNNLSGLIDYEQDNIDAFLTHQISERLAFRGTLGAVSYDPDDVQSYKGYEASLGLSYAFSETLSGELYLGPQWIDSETDLGAGTTTRTENGTLYGFGLTKQFERSNLTLSMRRGAVPTGSGEPLLQESLDLGYVYQISPRLSVNIPIAIFRNESISFGEIENVEERRIFFTAQPELTWNVTEDLRLRASYRYRYQRFEEADTSADGNAVFLSLSYIWPTEIPGLAP